MPANVPGDAADAASARRESFRVLFVCTANICRSAYLELAARAELGEHDEITVSSAGTHGFDAAPMEAEMARILDRRGVDTGGFRSRPLTRGLVEQADLVLTAAAQHRTFVLQEVPGAFRRVFALGQYAHGAARADPGDDVSDPYRQGPDAAEETAARLDTLLAQALTRLSGRR